MKQHLLRLGCALLASLLLCGTLAGLVGCVNPDDDGSSSATGVGSNGVVGQDTEKTATEYVPDIGKTDYNATFNVVCIGFDQSLLFLEEEDKREGNSLDEAVYERAVLIDDQIGVEFQFAEAGDWISYSGNVSRTVQTGDDAYQLVLTHVYQGVTDLVTSNALMSFSDLPSVNLDAPYWNRNLMDDLRIGDRYLLGYGDFLLSNTHCVVFNKDIMKEYRMEDPYQLVKNKKWTVDRLFEMASNVSRDNGDGKWTVDDYYGISGWRWVPLITLVTSCNMKIVDKDADTGAYYIAVEDQTERMLALIEKVKAMCEADYSYMWPATGYKALPFEDGHTLFQLSPTTSLIGYAAEDIRFGVLPYPKFDEAQEEYRSLNWNGVMGVPASVAKHNPKMVGDALELLGYYSGAVKTAYYEVQLGAKVAEAQEDADMLDIIWKSLVSDIGLVCCNSSGSMDSLVYMLPNLASDKKANFASYVKKNKTAAQKGLNRVFDQ